MLGGNRLLFTSLGLVTVITLAIGWVTFPSVSPVTQFQYDNPRNENYRPGGANCEPSALAKIAYTKVRLRQAENCQKETEEYRQSSDDLIQQTRAANAAQAQADIASQQLWSGWLQTLGGFLTLAAATGAAIYARDAAKEGKRSADEAERANLSLYAQLCPFDALIPRDNKLLLCFKNLGKTVAHCRYYSFNFVADLPKKPQWVFPGTVSHQLDTAIIGGGEFTLIAFETFPPTASYLLGILEYLDSKGETRKSTFRYDLLPAGWIASGHWEWNLMT